MSMSVSAPSDGDVDGDNAKVNSSINTTPLVDVMLVLLIIFLITIPVIRSTPVHVDLPNAVNIPTQTKPTNIVIYVAKDGRIFWEDDLVPNEQTLISKVAESAVIKPQPEIHIRADRDAQFASIGRVLFAIQRGGIVKVNFITEPDKNSIQQFLYMQH